jgi:hypothetical protein
MTQRCTRCSAPAGIVMMFNYQARILWLDDLSERVGVGEGYPLCEAHTTRATPPIGWTLIDRRGPVRPLFAALEVA